MTKESEKMATGIRAILMNHCRALTYFKPQQKLEDANIKLWSIKGWLEETQHASDNAWLFLSCPVNQRGLLKPLFTALISTAGRGLMNQDGYNPPRKTWFIIDELPSLEAISGLPELLAEIRKYNGCFVLGLQNISQLDTLYGHHRARTINSLTGTKLTFRLNDHDTAKHMASFLGEQEVLEASESISYGAHQMRDGVNLGEQRRVKPTITPTELMNLTDLTCYLSLPGPFPITKLQFTYHDLKTEVPAFVQGNATPSVVLISQEDNDCDNNKEGSDETNEEDNPTNAPVWSLQQKLDARDTLNKLIRNDRASEKPESEKKKKHSQSNDQVAQSKADRFLDSLGS